MRRGRRSIRLKGYDYSCDGAYFITLCTQNRECLFGQINHGKMILNHSGRIVADEWNRSAMIRNEIKLDEFIVMPNHFHGIVFIHDNRRGNRLVAPTVSGPRSKSIGSFVAGFKSSTTKKINVFRGMPGMKVWQRNYYDHIIRNDNELNRIREYIIFNPSRWTKDRENLFRNI